MIKMRKVTEIKLRAVGGPAHHADSRSEAIDVSVLVQEPETFYVSLCGLFVVSIFSTSHLLEMSNQRSDLADGEDGSGSREYTFYKVDARQKDIASGTFYRPDKDSSSFPLDRGPITLLRGQQNRGSDLAAKIL